jgi:uncharacterized protein (DUF885 family)
MDMGKTPAMRGFLLELAADLKDLDRYYDQPLSEHGRARRRRYLEEKQAELKKLDFDAFSRDDQADFILTRRWLSHRMRTLEIEGVQAKELYPLLPHAEPLIAHFEARQRVDPIDPEAIARSLAKITAELEKAEPAGHPILLNRALKTNQSLLESAQSWFDFYAGYDPLFTWWVKTAFERLKSTMEALSSRLKEKFDPSEGAIIGHAVGRDSLLADLAYEAIPYSPEELIAQSRVEYALAEEQMILASRELGFGDDWRAALEHVKNQHVAPGEQPALIREMVFEAINYVEEHDLVTLPPLAKETWRMQMMSPARQKVNPFFLGGESIYVSFPTDSMTDEEKRMSLRANNRYFCRAVVHHELFPGHNLQHVMLDRHHPERELFGTPFWIEGWTLWWEFLLWEMGFAPSPEDRIGMLFWRMHRCVRIEFSLGFHLGDLTPEQCIQMLIERVGHEPSTAEGEVRRSFNGDYPPLYQAAYMVGAWQVRTLAKEMTDTHGWSLKSFHDRFMREHQMPIAMLRAIMSNEPWSRDFEPDFKFLGRLQP